MSNDQTKTCSNCKFWDSEPANDYPETRVRRCKRAALIWDATEWGYGPAPLLVLKEEFVNVGMFVNDSSDYWAELLTKPTFFCSEWSEQGEPLG